MRVASEDLHLVMAELHQHITLSRLESGCLHFEVTQDSVEKTLFHVYEEFSCQDDFDAHQQRVGISTWGKVTTNAVRHYKVTVQPS